MRRFVCFGSIAFLVIAIACESGARIEQEPRTAPAVEPAAPGAAAGARQATEPGDTATDQPSGQPPGGGETTAAERAAGGDVVAQPEAVAPSAEGDRAGMKNWMLIEFVRAIESADLDWLERNGFRVDTVLSATTVRGWLEDPAGGSVIGNDPRIARIDAQMR